MQDAELLARIKADVDEEHRLRSTADVGDEDRARLTALEQHLDQLWDLLRQRRAKREAGEDPEATAERPADVVEHYRS